MVSEVSTVRDFKAPQWVIAWYDFRRVAEEVLAGLGFAGILLIIGVLGAIA